MTDGEDAHCSDKYYIYDGCDHLYYMNIYENDGECDEIPESGCLQWDGIYDYYNDTNDSNVEWLVNSGDIEEYIECCIRYFICGECPNGCNQCPCLSQAETDSADSTDSSVGKKDALWTRLFLSLLVCVISFLIA